MSDPVEVIGENAGKIWQVLSKKGPQELISISKEVDLKSAEANQALGWLAREDKITFEEKKGKVKVALKG